VRYRGGVKIHIFQYKSFQVEEKMKSAERLKKTDVIHDEISRLWGDVPVVDATKPLRVFIQPIDLKKATKKEPGQCVFAQACKRQFAATKVLFWRRVAYIELPDSTGKKRVERFRLSESMRNLIEQFDKGNPIIPEAGFELKVLHYSETFEGRHVKAARDRNSAKKRAAIEGERVIKKQTKPTKESMIKIDLEVRNGTGRVHFRNL
jgi:predicted GIY-YIG superfamily endonuclease